MGENDTTSLKTSHSYIDLPLNVDVHLASINENNNHNMTSYITDQTVYINAK